MNPPHDQALAPAWLNLTSGSSSHSDEHGKQNNGALPKNKLFLKSADYENGLLRSSSYRSSSNSSGGHDRDRNSRVQSYSSFNKSHRDRDRGRVRDKERDFLLDNGFDDPVSSRIERDPLRRSHSMVTGGRGLAVPKRTGSTLSNGTGSSSGSINAVSFEKDFPSLKAEEKGMMSDISRVTATGIATSIPSLSLSRPNGWTSALVEDSGKAGGNGVHVSSGSQTAGNMASVVSSTNTGLSMAEAVAQAPARVQTAAQSTQDTERKKELVQLCKLIPLVNKGQGHNSDKLKTKAPKSSDYIAPKNSLLSASQPHPPVTKPEVTKASQTNNYQVLNWGRNGVNSTAKDAPISRVPNREATSHASGAQAMPIHLPNTVNPKLKPNGTVGPEKKPLQGRSEFLNGLRKQQQSRKSSATNLDANLSMSSSSILQPEISGASAGKEIAVPTSVKNSLVVENGNSNALTEDVERLTPPDEEEAAFLRSLGWEENTGEEALTQEEIESFVIKHPKLSACTKLKAVAPESRQA